VGKSAGERGKSKDIGPRVASLACGLMSATDIIARDPRDVLLAEATPTTEGSGREEGSNHHRVFVLLLSWRLGGKDEHLGAERSAPSDPNFDPKSAH
jgi:hypothetical protein